MAQSDYNIAAHSSGLAQRTEINQIFDSILSHNSGNTAPSVTVAFMMWVDTSNSTYYYLKMRNHDNTAWVILGIYTVATKVYTSYTEDTVKLTDIVIGSGIQTFNGFGGTGGFKNKFINSTKTINTRGTTNNDNSYNYDMHYKVGNNWFRPIEGINLRSGKPHTISWDGAATCSYYIGTATSSTINAQTFTAIVKGTTITPVITAGQNIWFKFASDTTGSTYLNEQFEEGTIATPFELRFYGLEEILCQRYLPSITGSSITGTGVVRSSTTSSIPIIFKVRTRVPPTGIITNATNGNTNASLNNGNDWGNMAISFASASIFSANTLWTNSSATMTVGQASEGILNTNGYIYFTGCEL